jgi:hypothetical protein
MFKRENILYVINPLKAELNPICHLPALLGAHHILYVSRIRVNQHYDEMLNKNMKLAKLFSVPYLHYWNHIDINW